MIQALHLRQIVNQPNADPIIITLDGGQFSAAAVRADAPGSSRTCGAGWSKAAFLLTRNSSKALPAKCRSISKGRAWKPPRSLCQQKSRWQSRESRPDGGQTGCREPAGSPGHGLWKHWTWFVVGKERTIGNWPLFERSF